MLESGLLRGKEVANLLVHDFHSYYSYFLPHSRFPCFLCFSYFLFFFSFSLFLFTMHGYGLLYCLSWQDLPFYPINYFGPVMGALPRFPIGLLAVQPPPLHRIGRAIPHSQTKVVFVFVFLLPLHSHPDKGWVSLLLTPIACT